MKRINYELITNEFYANWFKEHVDKFMKYEGIRFIELEERDEIIKGFGKPFLMYLYIDNNKLYVSYSKKLNNEIKLLKEYVKDSHNSFMDIKKHIKQIFSYHLMHYHLFQYVENIDLFKTNETRMLTDIDYHHFYNFFTTLHPKSDPSEWLKDYFDKMYHKGFCFGTFKDNQLISLAETPDMPFMEDKIQHIGISTLENYRNRGYARKTVLACIQHLIKHDICPQWECEETNIGSNKLAVSVGFKKIADAIILY